jgi:protein TonB
MAVPFRRAPPGRYAQHARSAACAAFFVAAAFSGFVHAAPAGTAQDARPGVDTSTCSRPVYPEEDARLKNTGTVTIQFLIDADGRVLESKLQKSSGHSGLDEAARSALSKCRFKPAMFEGRPARAWTAVQYVWTPE